VSPWLGNLDRLTALLDQKIRWVSNLWHIARAQDVHMLAPAIRSNCCLVPFMLQILLC
jgi:hypothetical protein